jgi:hypothetical protein
MILGMDWLTLAHVLISLVGIATGLVLLLALMKGRNPANWAAWFLTSTVLTSITGFVFFPIEQVTPAQITGVISLIALGLNQVIQMIVQFGQIAPHMARRDPGREQPLAQFFKRHGTAP